MGLLFLVIVLFATVMLLTRMLSLNDELAKGTLPRTIVTKTPSQAAFGLVGLAGSSRESSSTD